MSHELIANLRQARDLAGVVVLVGNRQHDRFVLTGNPPEESRLVTLEGVLRAAFPDQPPPAVYDPATGQLTVSGQQPRTVARDALIQSLGAQCPTSFSMVSSAWRTRAAPETAILPGPGRWSIIRARATARPC